MKRIILALALALSLMGCSSSEEDEDESTILTCTLESDAYTEEWNYTYDDSYEITEINMTSIMFFDEEDLEEVSLEEYYEVYASYYEAADDVAGVSYTLSMDEAEGSITLATRILIATYDLEEDVYGITSDGEMDDASTLKGLHEATGYTCNELE